MKNQNNFLLKTLKFCDIFQISSNFRYKLNVNNEE